MFFNIFKKKDEKSTQKKVGQSTSNKRKVHSNRIGELGEYKINIQLDQLPDCLSLNDILIPNSKSKTGYSQVDHVVFSPYGIFVIETKNYAGTIYGDRNRGNWSVNGKFSFMNPFHQNFGHIQAIQTALSIYENSIIISIVSFTKRCTFKVNPELRKIQSQDLIVYDVELTEFIKRKINVLKLQNHSPIFNKEELLQLFTKLKSINITDSVIREKHIALLKTSRNTSASEGGKDDFHTCSVCGKKVSEKVVTFCLSNKTFDGKILCFEHQKNVENDKRVKR